MTRLKPCVWRTSMESAEVMRLLMCTHSGTGPLEDAAVRAHFSSRPGGAPQPDQAPHATTWGPDTHVRRPTAGQHKTDHYLRARQAFVHVW